MSTLAVDIWRQRDSRRQPAWSNLENMAGYRTYLQRLGLSPKTVKNYFGTMLDIARWARANNLEPRSMSAKHLFDYSKTKPASWSTQKEIRTAFDHFWRYLGKRSQPPTWLLRVPRKPPMVCLALEDTQAALYEAHAWSLIHRSESLAVLLGLYQGLRCMEIATIRVESFADNFTRVSLVGKGSKSATLPVPAPLGKALSIHLQGRQHGYVFPGKLDGHVAPQTVRLWLQRFCREAGLPHVNPHRLRHTCLATANDITGDLRAVQEFARHARPETTSGYTRTKWAKLVQVAASIKYGVA